MATRKITAEQKHNPKLITKDLAKGRTALYLEFFIGSEREVKTDEDGKPMYYTSGKMAGQPIYAIKHSRKKERLELYLITSPQTPEQREQNKETLALARKIRDEREAKFKEDRLGYCVRAKSKVDFITYYTDFLEAYSKKDKRNVAQSLNRFKAFVEEKHPVCVSKRKDKEGNEVKTYKVAFTRLTPDLVTEFVEYLGEHSRGEGAHSTYARFKKVVKAAYKDGKLNTNPCEDITIPNSDDELKKEVLTADEVQQLVSTHYKGENNTIREAFVFSLLSGIRLCDVRELTFENIDYTTNRIHFEQSKVKGHSKNSKVDAPLNPTLVEMIGTPEEQGKSRDSKIFELPSHTMCNKALAHWCQRAGITKKITWHCARLSPATEN